MNHSKTCIVVVFVATFFVAAMTHASPDTIGPNGINSAGLTLFNGSPLTGSGIAIGQVEPGRPGMMGFDPANKLHPSVNPTAVFRQDGAANLADADKHAEQVAGIMISTDAIATGVATGASLYASADNGVAPNFDQTSALAAQHIATRNGGDVRAINMSFGNPLEGSNILDGNSLLTQFVDWSASEHDVLHIAAGNQGKMIPVPKDNFNGMTIAASEKVGNVYRRVASFNTFNEDAVGPRTSIDLIAPGVDVRSTLLNNMLTPPVPNANLIDDGTSLAAPHVTGTVALLQEYGDERIANAGVPQWNANARRHEVMKAVLMNSADKLEDTGDGNRLGMTRTVLDSNGNDWLHASNTAATSSIVPLHAEFGAGHLNADRALKQFRSGEQDSDGADVPVIGWDYGLSTGVGDENRYAIGQSLRANSYLAVTLTWDRIVEFDNDGGTIGKYDIGDTFATYSDLEEVVNDLDIYLVRRGDDIAVDPAVASSNGNVSFGGGYNLEHLFFEIPSTDQYDIVVYHENNGVFPSLGSQNYGISWWGVTDALLGLGDFTGDGRVDFSDLAQWMGDFGVNAHSDADGDGDSDGFDFLQWQRGFGTGATPLVAAAATVPEPASMSLLLVSLVVAKQLRPRRRQAVGRCCNFARCILS